MTKYLNKTKIEWCDYTHNTVTGCLHGCPFCYARKMFHRFHKSFTPTFHPERLLTPLQHKPPSRIFEGSVTDMFGEWVEGQWLIDVFEMMSAAYWHDFIILTKNPYGIRKLYNEETGWYLGGGDYLPNVYLGVSVTDWSDFDRIDMLKQQWIGPKLVSFEPLINTDIHEPDLSNINWVIIGAQTQPTRYPDPHHVANIIRSADRFDVPVFMKDNLGDAVFKYCGGKRQESPKPDRALDSYRKARIEELKQIGLVK